MKRRVEDEKKKKLGREVEIEGRADGTEQVWKERERESLWVGLRILQRCTSNQREAVWGRPSQVSGRVPNVQQTMAG
jgi:hypothetical protein